MQLHQNKKTNLGCLIPIILFEIAVGFSATIQYKDERESKKAEIAAEQEAKRIEQEALALEQTMVYANKGEWCEKSGYHVMVDDARTYEFFTDHNDSSYKISEYVANDESRIAVHIVFENTSDKSLRVTPAVSVTDENKLQAEAIRFNAYTAFGDYRLDDDDTDFEGHELESNYEVLSGNRIEGWRFFIVNTKSKTLTVRYGDYSEITIDNPAYKEN